MRIGDVYIFSNPCLPGLLKIGMTEDGVEKRRKNASNTSVVDDFVTEHSARVMHPRTVEREIHEALAYARTRGGKEFFRLPIDEAIHVMNRVVASYRVADDASVSGQGRKKATDRLRDLPEVFDLRDVEVELGADRARARQYCWRWVEAGLVRAAGPKAGVYYNLVRDAKGPANRVYEAATKLLRLPLIQVGGTSLYRNNWTTQRHFVYDIAVPVSRGQSYVQSVDGANLAPRYQNWFAALMAWSDEMPDTHEFVVRPEMALADAILANEKLKRVAGHAVWTPSSDDVDVPSEKMEDVVEAMRSLGVRDDAGLERLLSPYGWRREEKKGSVFYF
jgi:hypothetical protein